MSKFEQLVEAEPVGELALKGFAKPIWVYSIKALAKGVDSSATVVRAAIGE